MSERWERLTLSQRKAVFAAASGALVAVVAVLLAFPQEVAPVEPVHDREAGSVTGAPPMDRPTSTPAPGSLADGAGTARPLPLPGEDLAAAKAVAGAFVVEYARGAPDEHPDRALARLRPYLSEQPTAAFAGDSGRTADRAAAAAAGETVEVTVEHVTTEFVAGDEVGLLVVVRRVTTGTAGRTEAYLSFSVRVERRDSGWLVTDVVA